MPRVASDCIIETQQISGLGSDQERLAVLRHDFEECKVALGSLSVNRPKSLEIACQSTRIVWNHLHDWYLFTIDCQQSKETFDSLAAEFISAIENSLPAISQIVDSVQSTERDFAISYMESIKQRMQWVILLCEQGLSSVYRSFLAKAKLDDPVNERQFSFFDFAIGNSLNNARLSFTRLAFQWLIHKAGFVVAELNQEHGPYPESTITHKKIIGSTTSKIRALSATCEVSAICKIVPELPAKTEFTDESDDAAPFLELLEELLDTLSTAEEALNDIAEKVGKRSELADTSEIRLQAEQRIDDTKAVAKTILSRSVFLLEELDNRFWISHSQDNPQTILRVLIYPEKFPEDNTVAHCLNFDLVASASDETTAISDLELMIPFQLKDFKNKNCKFLRPSPAPFEFVDAWNSAGESKTLRSEGWILNVRRIQECPTL
ncbi:MAG: hypothetical protein Tsb009_22670 [Planctomycetaceae bacterium]